MKHIRPFSLNENTAKPYLMSKTYQVSDEEPAEHGDYKDQGFEYEDETFDSLWAVAQEIRDAGATEPSNSPTPNKNTWYSTPDGEQNMRTGERKYYSFHPKLNDDNEAKELAALIKMDRTQFNRAEPGMDESLKRFSKFSKLK